MKDPKKMEKFILTYEDLNDPTPGQIDEVLKRLDSFRTEEVVPGTIRVTGARGAVEQATNDMQKWNLSTEKSLSDTPPHKSQIR